MATSGGASNNIPDNTSCNIGRRTFLQQMGVGAVGSVVGTIVARHALAEQAFSAPTSAPATTQPTSQPAIDVGSIRDLPTRQLGRLKIQVPMLGFGTASMGHSFAEPEHFEQVVNAAIDAGIRYLDTARNYDIAEERLKPVLAKRRKEVFLVTKTWAKSRDDCLRSLEKSMTTMGVDQVDLCHIHNVGEYAKEGAIGKDSCLAGLQEAKKRGLIKHIGCTGHMKAADFVPILETGEIDVMMVAMNFVDRHTYLFEDLVLPVARKHDVGIVAMKVYGGVTGSWDGYKAKRPGRLVADEHRQDAFDYVLSIPNLAMCVVGMKTLDELRLAIHAVRHHKPLTGSRREAVLAKGARMAKEWGPHFGEA
ncbi:MAG: aldo/keto reductase [Phycisphaerae bacterium]|nr:aldo/keto reductase [Phycisphaerae bacterium]